MTTKPAVVLWLSVLAFAPGAGGQQNQGMQALYQAIRSHDYDHGRSSMYDHTTPQTMLNRVNRSTIQELAVTSNALLSSPNDANLLFRRGFAAMQAADQDDWMRQGWLHFAALDLEKSLHINPNNWVVEHDYAETCYETGTPGYPIAVRHFTAAIRLNPKSARSYEGRGFAYLAMHDQAQATANLQQALRMDPSLRPEIDQQLRAMAKWNRDTLAAQQTLRTMSRWQVDPTARTAAQCSAHAGNVVNGKCIVVGPPQ
jgi:tetratricopeptide (TPR) repeat protein